ncbi:hypothetical protein OE352_000536 [Salmonella bongori]|uniref:hypothetical protein n=1 Tax=Salmonella bongori TaxID=54736 RepID=UPI0015E7F474|nr:hypothetical protein [Salmonella bongori]EHU5138487.1 hypothetical protein [Salmonella bongori]EIL5514460.1 hypothetical protein [Salmonella bongori]EIZ4350178.1 hypothetical protein [Salmonella bongori serovar 48:z81:-]EJX9718110.1 hypothetical protein [Salmonella bongori]EJX9724639.1 hypothetical protein [Salmonella bongori]
MFAIIPPSLYQHYSYKEWQWGLPAPCKRRDDQLQDDTNDSDIITHQHTKR